MLIRQQRCVGCHAISDFGKTCANCKRKGWAIDGVMALTSFDQELVSEIVHAVKYRGQSAAGKWLGRRMAVGLPAWMLGGEYVFCAVPLHWWGEWQRRFNQARFGRDILPHAQFH